MMNDRTAGIRSFAVAVYLLGRGVECLGVELDRDRIVYRFRQADAMQGQRAYTQAKKTLDDMVDAVRLARTTDDA
jgi:hypothetical protein